ncbi:MAG: hypothetical protein KA151_05320 [Piscinibacter sp.]|jgi:hypothetical protein|nr:hypothetical protein [Piscinibacter sp.]
MQSTTLNQALASAPLPLAPELLKFIGGGVAAPTSSPTPQAPKNKW